MNFFTILLASLWLMLPAIVANSAPVFFAQFQILENFKKPIHAKLLGENKTWRGLIVGIILGTFTAFLQWNFYFQNVLLFPYRDAGLGKSLLLGFLLSFGILGTDMLKSYFKRRLHKPPGSAWPPFDELDFLGAFLLMLFLYIPPTPHFWLILIGAPLFHTLANLFGYFFKLKNVWY